MIKDLGKVKESYLKIEYFVELVFHLEFESVGLSKNWPWNTCLRVKMITIPIVLVCVNPVINDKSLRRLPSLPRSAVSTLLTACKKIKDCN